MSEARIESYAELRSANWFCPIALADILRASDLFLIMASSVIAKLIYVDRVRGVNDDIWMYMPPAAISAVIFGILVARQGHYRPRCIGVSLASVALIVSALAASFLCLMALAYVMKFGQMFSRGWAATWFLIAVVALVANRAIFASFFAWLTEQGAFRRRVAIVGAASASAELQSTLKDMPDDYDFLGVFGNTTTQGEQKSLDDLVRIGQLGAIDEVIIAAPILETESTRSAIDKLRVLPVDVWVYSPEWNLGVPIREVDHLGSIARLKVQARPISERGALVKAIEDYTIAAVALILLSPVFLIIAIAIKLDSPGPVFFRQKRHGFNHKIFDVWKFRSMTVMEDGRDVVQARRNDQRITRVGRFLRMTSLDELPQLINVLLGEMSVVGPRPHALLHNQLYSELLHAYANRHRVKPGITGWAQINGFRGPTEDPELMRRRVELDLYYIDNWSLWFDLKILLVTPALGFVNKNAL